MAISIGGSTVIDNSRKGIFQSANVGTYTNPERPGTATVGDLIWSITDSQLQVWNGSEWVRAVGAGQSIVASGGAQFIPGNGYTLHVFTSPGTFTLSSSSALVEYAIVAGGGGGGGPYQAPSFAPQPQNPAGGAAGGGGGVLVGMTTFTSGDYTITIGGGGAGGTGPSGAGTGGGNGSNGGNSIILGPVGVGSFTAFGGGGGGGYFGFARPGGCGGGLARAGSGAIGYPGQGFPSGSFPASLPLAHPGWNPFIGAGGGADQPGGDGGNGGAYFGRGLGLEWEIPDSYGTDSYALATNGDYSNNNPARHLGRYFGGGGASGQIGISTVITYTPGGGGVGQSSGPVPVPSNPGITNTGGGGGSRVASPGSGGGGGTSGGSGIVIIRYANIQ